ncbi:MAG: helix-turn-helix domain-containing protein [Actinobacteria bacterium]|nr:helix-turn-helix domain-containing protein [Actinomycetota bacterium]
MRPAPVPDETTDQSLLQMRRALGRQLAALRNRAGLSQWDLAPMTGYSRSTLSDAELGRHRLRREFWVRCDGLLKAENRLVAGYDRIESAGAVLRQRPGDATRPVRDELASARLRAVRALPDQEPAPPAPPAGTAADRASRVAMESCPHCRRPIAVLVVPSNPA